MEFDEEGDYWRPRYRGGRPEIHRFPNDVAGLKPIGGCPRCGGSMVARQCLACGWEKP